MFVVCKKCGVEHDARDVNNGICVWCEQKETKENQVLQSSQYYYNFNVISNNLYKNYNASYTGMKLRG